jgi:hypothetical protein
MEISVRSNVKEFLRYLDDVQKKQVPFALSRALNDVAIDSQEAAAQRAQEVFQNRKRWWLKQQPTGIKVKFSKKSDLHAKVFTPAYFSEIQEKGGTKTPKRSGKLAIPTNAVPKKYRTSRGAKEMIDERSNVFVTPKGVFKRTGKKNISVLWTFARAALVKPRFGFYTVVEETVKRKFATRFYERLKQALASAKPPSLK